MLHELTICDSTSSIHHLIHSTLVLPISLHRLLCLLHLRTPRPVFSSSSALRTLASVLPISSLSPALLIHGMCLVGFFPLLSPEVSVLTLFTFEKCCPCRCFTSKSILNLFHL